MKKRVFSILLAVLMVCSIIPIMTFSASASKTYTFESGSVKDLSDAIWKLEEGETLDVTCKSFCFSNTTGQVDISQYSDDITVNFYGTYFYNSDSDPLTDTLFEVNGDDVTLNFYNCRFSTVSNGQPVCVYRGSAIYVDADNCTIDGHRTTLFNDCGTTRNGGGAVYVDDGAENCLITGCEFKNCFYPGAYWRATTGYGTCIYVASCECTIYDCHFNMDGVVTDGGTHYCVYSEEGDTAISYCGDNSCYIPISYSPSQYFKKPLFGNCKVVDTHYVAWPNYGWDIENGGNGAARNDYILYTALDSKLSVDIEGGKFAVNAANANAHLWENGEANVFTFIWTSSDDAHFYLQSKTTGLVLDGTSSQGDVGIQQQVKQNSQAQRWSLDPSGDGYYYVRCGDGRYMEVAGDTATVGTKLRLAEFTGKTNQKFRPAKVNDIAEGDYYIFTEINEKMSVDIDGGYDSVNASGKNVHLWENGAANIFTITKDQAKGTYIITCKRTGCVLGVENGSKADGANIAQWTSDGSDSQRWMFEQTVDGYCYIRCIGGQYMDVSGADAFNDANIHSWGYTGRANQRFRLVKARPIEDGDYVFVTGLNGKSAVDIEGGKSSKSLYRKTHMWENGEANVFTVTWDDSKNSYEIKCKVTGLVLDAVNNPDEYGKSIMQEGDYDTYDQRWIFEESTDGYYHIRCLGGQYMTVEKYNADNGSNVLSCDLTGALNQKFKLDKKSSNNLSGSVLSDGSIWILVAVGVLAVGGIVAAIIVLKKKKKPVLAGAVSEKADSNDDE